MPKATLPTSARGWAVALIASMIGFIFGFASTNLLVGIFGGGS